MRSAPSIPTASMADIAFLLLLFFLVATAIRSDAGLPVTLPPVGAGHAMGVPELLLVQVNARGEMLVNGEPADVEQAWASVAAWGLRAAVPRVALQAHRETTYNDYVAALDAVLMGHRDSGTEPRLTLREPAR